MSYIITDHPNPKYFISWGKGLQSTTLGVLAVKNLLPYRIDAIITADTGWEHQHTYDIESYYTKYFQDNNIPVYKVQAGDIHNDFESNFSNLPLWSKEGYPLKRQCTSLYKILPIRQKMRELCGLRLDNKGRTLKKTAYLVLGISYDESERISVSNRNWIYNTYPLVDMKWKRKDCQDFLSSNNLPVPMKSSCVICPYKSPAMWKFTKDNYPNDFQSAVYFDNKIRFNDYRKASSKTKTELFLYKKLVSLQIADFTDEDVLDVCDSGYCFV